MPKAVQPRDASPSFSRDIALRIKFVDLELEIHDSSPGLNSSTAIT
jgi:hypothetical protein